MKLYAWMKNFLVSILLVTGIFSAGQAFAYTMQDYYDAQLQVSNAQSEIYYIHSQISYVDTEINNLQIQGSANYAVAHCGGNYMDQYQYNDCVNGYLIEYEELISDLYASQMQLYSELGWAEYGLSQAEALRAEIALALGI